MLATIELTDGLVALGEPKGVVYTKPWVVDLILDLGERDKLGESAPAGRRLGLVGDFHRWYSGLSRAPDRMKLAAVASPRTFRSPYSREH